MSNNNNSSNTSSGGARRAKNPSWRANRSWRQGASPAQNRFDTATFPVARNESDTSIERITQSVAAADLADNDHKAGTGGQTRKRAARNRRRHQPLQNSSASTVLKQLGSSFSDLPTEIRLRIWQLVAHDPRLIEMGHNPNERSHNYVRIVRESRRAPAILHVNMESRAEGFRYYEMRRFDSLTNATIHDREHWTYYNSSVDTLYFGLKGCINSIFVATKLLSDIEMPRVAIEMTGRITMCCDLDDHAYGAGDGRNGGAELMQVLHGISPQLDFHNDDYFRGFHGLREVIFVVPSNLWPVEEVTRNVGFRPATHDGLTKGQQAFKARILAEEATIIEHGGPAEVCTNIGHAKWKKDMKPRFTFLSFAPKKIGLDAMVYDSLPASVREITKLRCNDDKFLKHVERRTRCVIKVPEQVPGEFQREVGFFGEKKRVEDAKAEVLDKLGSSYVGIVDMINRRR